MNSVDSVFSMFRLNSDLKVGESQTLQKLEPTHGKNNSWQMKLSYKQFSHFKVSSSDFIIIICSKNLNILNILPSASYTLCHTLFSSKDLQSFQGTSVCYLVVGAGNEVGFL